MKELIEFLGKRLSSKQMTNARESTYGFLVFIGAAFRPIGCLSAGYVLQPSKTRINPGFRGWVALGNMSVILVRRTRRAHSPLTAR